MLSIALWTVLGERQGVRVLALRKAYNYAFPDKKHVHIHSSYDTKLAERVAGSHA